MEHIINGYLVNNEGKKGQIDWIWRKNHLFWGE